jgi:transposase
LKGARYSLWRNPENLSENQQAKLAWIAATDPLSNGLIESTNTKIRLITRIAFGFRSPEALIALAMLNLGGHRPILPGLT